MEKKYYSKPFMAMERFKPQEYCAPCGDGPTTVTYYFECDAGNPSSRYDVILDSNGDGEPSGHSSFFGWIWDDTNLTPSTWYFYPCEKRHEVTVPAGTIVDAIFPFGFMFPEGGHDSATKIPVRIWRGDNGNEVHCTTNLRSESYTPHYNVS